MNGIGVHLLFFFTEKELIVAVNTCEFGTSTIDVILAFSEVEIDDADTDDAWYFPVRIPLVEVLEHDFGDTVENRASACG